MTIPRENALAFFPASVKAGNITLGPLTLSGAVRLGEMGVDMGQRVPRDLLFRAAYVLAGSSVPLDRWLKTAHVGLNDLSNAVEKVLNDAFETFVEPVSRDGGTIHLTPHGIGWPLEYAEFLCSEYGWSWETSIGTPVATVFALYAAYRQRNGGKHKMDYIEREYAKKLKKDRSKDG